MSEPTFIKFCPKCSAPLKILTNHTTGHEFVGCSRWSPDRSGCNHTESVPESFKLRRQGIKDMFEDDAEGERTLCAD